MKVRSLIIKHASAGLEMFSRHQGYMGPIKIGLSWSTVGVGFSFLMIFSVLYLLLAGNVVTGPSRATVGVLQLTVIRRSVLGISSISHICTRKNV